MEYLIVFSPFLIYIIIMLYKPKKVNNYKSIKSQEDLIKFFKK